LRFLPPEAAAGSVVAAAVAATGVSVAAAGAEVGAAAGLPPHACKSGPSPAAASPVPVHFRKLRRDMGRPVDFAIVSSFILLHQTHYLIKDRELNNFPNLVATLRVSLGTRLGG
jgi:hypothetical protein